jgi:hypothetical protein
MKEARKSLIVLLVSSTAVFGAQYRAVGGSISYVVSVDSKLQNGSFPQFDPSLGPLNSITYSGNVNVGVLPAFVPGIEFDEPVSSLSYNGLFQFLLGTTSNGTISYYGPVVTPVGGTETFDPPTYGPVYIDANLSVSGSLDVTSFFDGTGQIYLQSSTMITVSPPAINTPAGADVGALTFTYTYGVPEPSGLVLASIAAILPLYLIVRRRLAKRAGCV